MDSYQISDVLYEIEENLLDANVIIHSVEAFLDLWQTAEYL